MIANTDIGGLSISDAQKTLESKISLIKNQDIDLVYNDQINTIKPSDLEVTYQLSQSLDVAYTVGRNGNIWSKFVDRIKSIYQEKKLQVAFQINKTNLDKIIDQLSSNINQPLKNATLAYNSGNLSTTTAQIGYRLENDRLSNSIIKIIGNLDESRLINLPVIVSQPELDDQNIVVAKQLLQTIFSKKSILSFDNKNFEISRQDIFDWSEFISTPSDIDESEFNLQIVFNEQKIKIIYGFRLQCRVYNSL